jgi:hypothetical protein
MYHQHGHFIPTAAKRVAPHGFQERSIPAGYVSTISRTSAHATRRKGLFSRFVDALHASRRLQASRLIRQNGHLVAPEYEKYRQWCLQQELNNANQI